MLVAIVHLLLTAVSVMLVSKVLPGIRVRSYGSAVGFAFVVAILNAIAWFFLAPLTIPFAIITLGIGILVVNAFVFLLADKMIEGVEIDGFGTALLASLGVSFVNWTMHLFFGKWAP
jgi:putative membrane protein